MYKSYSFYAQQKPIKLKPKDDREVKRDKFKKIKEKVIK
tara:strand:- start:384 stop:500 length:117 start_codon:yes stop_codon:yes gene_type:complete